MFRNLDLVNIKYSLFTLPVDHFGSHVAFPDVLRLALFSAVLPLLQFLFVIPLVQFPLVLPLVYFLFVLPPVFFPVEYYMISFQQLLSLSCWLMMWVLLSLNQ